MAVVAVFGNAKASIRNTGTSPIAIIFMCISLIFIVDSLPLLFPMKNNSSFVAEPHLRFESVFDPGKLGIRNKIYVDVRRRISQSLPQNRCSFTFDRATPLTPLSFAIQ
jgi:hypothetical protein